MFACEKQYRQGVDNSTSEDDRACDDIDRAMWVVYACNGADPARNATQGKQIMANDEQCGMMWTTMKK